MNLRWGVVLLSVLAAACGGDDGGAPKPPSCAAHAILDGDTCVCDLGYTGDPAACADVDECADGTATCDPGDTCTNTDGSYACVAPPPEFVAIAAGGTSACALRDDHALWCWGGGRAQPAQLGDASWLSIAVADDHACGLHVDGTLWCFGANDQGQLGVGDTSVHAAPVQVGSATYVEVAVGGARTCAIAATDRAVACWGDGVVAPATIGTASWTHVAVGAHHQCGIQTDGKLYCWGANDNDQLGLGDGPDLAAPTLVDSRDGWTAVTASAAVTCALHGDTPFCWGGTTLPVGTGPSTSDIGWGTPEVITLPQATTIAVGASVGCATAPDGLYCWGDDEHGQIGDGDTAFAHENAPQQISRDAWVAVAVGDAFACGIDAADHRVQCWGDNAFGALGLGTQPTHLAPVQVGTATSWGAISGVDDTTCALHADTHALECWGKHGNGDATPVHHQVPAPLFDNLGVAAVGLVDDGGCVVTTDGTLACWSDKTAVSTEDAATTWGKVGGGPARGHACGIQTDGALYCWGTNAHGELGIGATDAAIHKPVRVGALTDWQQVVVRDAPTKHACALRSHLLFCWGEGYGTSPVQVGSATDWQTLSASSALDLGLRGGGAAYAWNAGSLPAPYADSITDWTAITDDVGIRADSTLWPTASGGAQIGTASDWAELAGSGNHCARRRDGTLWCFGSGLGDDGVFGQGDAWRTVPTAVVGLPSP